jgi:tRNA1(Val) A37 N6-methylase TrmN6
MSQTQMSLFDPEQAPSQFDLVIANPPYKKISSRLSERTLLEGDKRRQNENFNKNVP